jgi:oxalate decarboxylase/phosphoglucose isomerase-like protein (cupin superfamily)
MDKDTSKFSIKPNVQKIVKPWGFELILSTPTSKITSKILHIDAGKRFSLQYHDEKEEVLTLLSGEANIYLSDSNGQVQKTLMEQRRGYLIVPFQTHRVEAISDCEISESSTPESGNTVRLEDDYKRTDETVESRAARTSDKPYMG